MPACMAAGGGRAGSTPLLTALAAPDVSEVVVVMSGGPVRGARSSEAAHRSRGGSATRAAAARRARGSSAPPRVADVAYAANLTLEVSEASTLWGASVRRTCFARYI